MVSQNNRPNFTALYFDTNVLLANRWPQPAPALHNVLTFARWWNIGCHLPYPVLDETEQHWIIKVRDAARALDGARNSLAKAAAPFPLQAPLDHTPVTELREAFLAATEKAISEFNINRIDFTSRPLREIFLYAARYIRPFAPKGEGKGFKDVVIFLSIVDHLQQHPTDRGVLITNDEDFKNVDYETLVPTFDRQRLRISSLDVIFDELFGPHLDETRVKPYRRLLIALDQHVRQGADRLQAFISAHLTADMLRPGLAETAQQINSIESVDVRSVDFPFPDTMAADTSIDVTIKVLVTCRAIVTVNVAMLHALFGRVDSTPAPRLEEKLVSWIGALSASADVVAGELNSVEFGLLATE